MKKFLIGLISAIVKYTFVVAAVSFISLCFMTQSFPPKWNEVKTHVNNLRNASANYKNMVNRSRIEAEKYNENGYSENEQAESEEAVVIADKVDSEQTSSDEINILKEEVADLQRRLSRLEKQQAETYKLLRK